MKKCFTINTARSTEEFKEYEKLLDEGIYQAVEIFFPYNLSEDNYSIYYNNVRNLKARHLNCEVVMHLPFGVDNNLCDLNDYVRIVQRMKDGIEFTSHFGTKKLTLHLGGVKKDVPRKDYINHIVPVLKVLCTYASKYNMNVMIENMPKDIELGYSPNEIREIIDSVGMDNLKFILDTGHAHVSDYEIEDYIELLHDKLYHIHFSDNMGKSDEHKRMGLGNIDFEKVFNKLQEVGYDQLHCMEVIYQDVSILRDFAEDFDKYSK